MKSLIILHGLGKNPADEWYQSIAKMGKIKGFKSFVPKLPTSFKPNLEQTYNFILKNFQLDSNTTLIGHSSGATLILGILQKLPPEILINKVILVACPLDPFLTDLLHKYVPRQDYADLFPSAWDWNKIKRSAKRFIVLYSDNDPYVQPRHATDIYSHLGGQLIEMPGYGHFSINTGGEKLKDFEGLIKYL